MRRAFNLSYIILISSYLHKLFAWKKQLKQLLEKISRSFAQLLKNVGGVNGLGLTGLGVLDAYRVTVL
jgi:hypothetical protein